MATRLVDQVLRSPRLPSLPAIAMRVIDLVHRKDVAFREIAEVISHDPALTGKILKTVNSAYYAQAQKVGTISQALVVLGLSAIKTLALGFCLVPHLKGLGGERFDLGAFWRRSLYGAVAARSIAKAAGLPLQEEAFLAGLMQDIGQLALSQTIPAEYGPVLAKAGADHRALAEMEMAALEIDHTQVGAALAEQWNLPESLALPIRIHESPAALAREERGLARAVALGARAADVFCGPRPPEALETFYRLAEEWFALPRARAEGLLVDTHRYSAETRRLLDLPGAEAADLEQIMARANESLQALALEQQAHSTSLEKQNQALSEQASTDALTGVANRRQFDARLSEAFARAQAKGGRLSLIFLDIDHFKKFNDTHGHQTGDRVLAEVGRVLKQHVEGEMLVARYGGEEFAAVLPGMGRAQAGRMAEVIRRAIEATKLALPAGAALSVTASLGVASLDGEGQAFARVEQLVRAADQGVYAAKAAGRNCVRVYAPRDKSAG